MFQTDGIRSVSARAPRTSAARDLFANADFAACLAELERVGERSTCESERVEVALLRARANLRCDRPGRAVSDLEALGDLGDDMESRCSAKALLGFALVSSGRHDEGMRLLRLAGCEAEEHDVSSFVRLDALYHLAFGHWIICEYDDADTLAARACSPLGGVISARATALRAWVRVGRTRFADALALFREAWNRYRSCTARDSAFEASVVHALAMYGLQLLDRDGVPEYHSASLPSGGGALGTYRLLINRIDAWRAALHGDQDRAIQFATAMACADVAAHWQTFALVTQAGIADAFGHHRFARAYTDVAVTQAVALDWNEAPGESRFALLDLAERLAAYDAESAAALLSRFSRLAANVEPRYFNGAHRIHRATECRVRGTVGLERGNAGALAELLAAYEAYQEMGFLWPAATVQLLLGRASSHSGKRAYQSARAFIVERFPRAYLVRQLHDYSAPFSIDASTALTQAHMAIIRGLCAGRSTSEIAAQRGTSVGTIYNQLKEIYRRTDVHSIGAIIAKYGPATV